MIQQEQLEHVKVDRRERAEILDGTPWCESFEWKEILNLAAYMDTYLVVKGGTVIQEGDRDGPMCLVIKGQVSVRKRGESGEDRTLATIGRNKTFGEMSIIDGEPASASIVADHEMMVMVMTPSDFARLQGADPKIGQKLILRLARIISQRLRLASGQLVRDA